MSFSLSNPIHRLPPLPTAIHPFPKQSIEKERVGTSTFSKALDEAKTTLPALTISKHARQRMAERNISITPHEWQQIGNKVEEAKQKGVNDSLVLLKDAALIVNAENRTVVTAVDRREVEIFTNIDGTIVMESI